MAVITSGKTFANGEQLSASKLNQVITAATFNQADAVDGSTMTLIGGAMAVAEGGIATAKIADDAVTSAKIAAGALTDAVYPVGSIFTTVTNYADSAAVVSAIGGTTWTAFGAGRVLVGLDASDTDFDTAEETGGAKTVTLSQAQMNHTHQWNKRISDTFTERNFIKMEDATNSNRDVSFDASGNNQDYTDEFELRQNTFTSVNQAVSGGSVTAHNNLQPYIVVYMWKRTA